MTITDQAHADADVDGTLVPWTLIVSGLQDALLRALPHRAPRSEGLPQLEGILLDVRGDHVYVVATDRYTLAVSSAALDAASAGGDPWQLHLGPDAVDALAEMLAHADPDEPVTLQEQAVEDGFLDVVASTRYRHVSIGEEITPGHGEFPDWRGLVAQAIAVGDQMAAAPPALDARTLERWQHLDSPVSICGSGRAALITAPHFLGLQVRAAGHADAVDSAPATWIPAVT